MAEREQQRDRNEAAGFGRVTDAERQAALEAELARMREAGKTRQRDRESGMFAGAIAAEGAALIQAKARRRRRGGRSAAAAAQLPRRYRRRQPDEARARARLTLGATPAARARTIRQVYGAHVETVLREHGDGSAIFEELLSLVPAAATVKCPTFRRLVETEAEVRARDARELQTSAAMRTVDRRSRLEQATDLNSTSGRARA